VVDVRGPSLVNAKQDRSICVQDLPKVIMSGSRFRWAEQRLIPLKAASNISNADDCPGRFIASSCSLTLGLARGETATDKL